MSHLSNELKSIAAAHNIIPIEISRSSGMPPSQISRIWNSVQVYVSHEDMEKLKVAVCQTDEERAQLTRARMLDHCTGLGSDLLEVVVNIRGKERGTNRSLSLPVRLDPDVREALLFMGHRSIEVPAVSAGIISLARMLGCNSL